MNVISKTYEDIPIYVANVKHMWLKSDSMRLTTESVSAWYDTIWKLLNIYIWIRKYHQCHQVIRKEKLTKLKAVLNHVFRDVGGYIWLGIYWYCIVQGKYGGARGQGLYKDPVYQAHKLQHFQLFHVTSQRIVQTKYI